AGFGAGLFDFRLLDGRFLVRLLVGSFVGCFVRLLVGSFIGCFVRLLVGSFIGCFVRLLVGCFVRRFFGRFVRHCCLFRTLGNCHFLVGWRRLLVGCRNLVLGFPPAGLRRGRLTAHKLPDSYSQTHCQEKNSRDRGQSADHRPLPAVNRHAQQQGFICLI